MFYDNSNTAHPLAYLDGHQVSPELEGVRIELSFTSQGKLLASFQPKDFMRVSRLDMRNLLARSIECATQPSTVLLSATDVTVTVAPKS